VENCRYFSVFPVLAIISWLITGGIAIRYMSKELPELRFWVKEKKPPNTPPGANPDQVAGVP
jgi:hypothetical protein